MEGNKENMQERENHSRQRIREKKRKGMGKIGLETTD
jgi:hypothetical protein